MSFKKAPSMGKSNGGLKSTWSFLVGKNPHPSPVVGGLCRRVCRSGLNSVIVVPFRLSYDQAVSVNSINQPMLLIDSLGPPSRKLPSQWLWFSCTSERIPFGFFNQSQQPLRYPWDSSEPILQVLEGPLPKFQAHASNPGLFQRPCARGF
jgi:hypothetical protein